MMVIENSCLDDEERACRKAKIAAGCELYSKMVAQTGRLPHKCWSKIMDELGSPQWMKRHHLYNEIKRKRQQEPKSDTRKDTESTTKQSIVTISNDDVSEASTLDELIKSLISTENSDDVSDLTEYGPEDRGLFNLSKGRTYARTDLKPVKKKLYATSPDPIKVKPRKNTRLRRTGICSISPREELMQGLT